MKRKEHDFLGEMSIDDECYYGIQTMRHLKISNVSGHNYGLEARELIVSLAQIKKATALANSEIGALTNSTTEAIVSACDEIISQKLNNQFPIDMLTGGGGVALHMNMNEVIANRANELLTGHKGYELVHPNTHVNMGQSTNDVIPAAMLLALHGLFQTLLLKTQAMHEIFLQKSIEYAQAVKLSRTCLQDALPITFGQELSAHVSFLQRQMLLLKSVAAECLVLPLGATAVGTGLGTLPGFEQKLFYHLKKNTNLALSQNSNLFDALQHADIYSHISYALKSLASGLSKIAADLRIQSSGPRAGFGEIILPELAPGSSIMPGKINPIMPELMIQIYFQVCGNELAVSLAVERSELNLNVWESVIYKSLNESFRLLIRGIPLFTEHCLSKLSLNKEHCLQQAEKSIALSAIISAVFGYEAGSKVAKIAYAQNKTIATVAVEQGLLDSKIAKELLNPMVLTSAKHSQEAIQKLRRIIEK